MSPNTYLVDAYWSADAEYAFVNLADPELNIQWPIPSEEAIISDKDLNHPPLSALDLREVDVTQTPVAAD